MSAVGTSDRELEKKKQQDFLAYVAHELRTPLNGMIGLAYGMVETETNKGRQKHLKMIQSSAQRLVGIVNSIMDISALRDGKMEIKPIDNCDLKEVAEEVYQLMLIAVDKNNKKIKKDSVDLQLQVDPTTPLVQADKERITQIIFNLTNNALKFTPAGFVKIAVSNEPLTNTVLCCVSDSGKGIKPENLTKIFEPFGQEEEGKGGGLGLGLSIVTKIADLHGGNVWVESELGRGSAFFVRLPLKMCPKVAAPAAPDATPAAAPAAATVTAPTAAASALQSKFDSANSQTSAPAGGRQRRARFGSHRSHLSNAQFQSKGGNLGGPQEEGQDDPVSFAEEGERGAVAQEELAIDSTLDFGGMGQLSEARRLAKEKKLSIAIVESEESDYTALVELLKSEEIQSQQAHAVTWFRDAYGALDHLENASLLPDLVFVSVDLPGLNAFQFVEEIRQFCPPSLPVILTAKPHAQGGVSAGVRAEATTRLATGVVQKDPWDKKEVGSLVRATAVNAELTKLAVSSQLQDEVFKLLVPERRRGQAAAGEVHACVMVAKIKDLELIRSILTISQHKTLLVKIQTILDTRLNDNDCFRVESPSDEYVVASDAPECVERVLEYVKQCLGELKNVKVAGRQLEFFVGVAVGSVDGIFLTSGSSTLPRFMVTGEPLQWAHLLSLTGFANHVHLSEEAYVAIEKEFGGSGLYDCYPRGTLRHRKTFVMRNAANEDPAQFTHASLDFFLMHALNFREGAEEVIQQLEGQVKNLQLRVELMRGGACRNAAMTLVEQELVKNKTLHPSVILGVISDPVEQLLSSVDTLVASCGDSQAGAPSPLVANLDAVIADFEQMLLKADMSSAGLRETRKAARQVAATSTLPDSTALVVTGEAAGVLGHLLDDLMDVVGDRMRHLVEQDVRSNAAVETQRRFEQIIIPLQEEVDLLAAEIENIQVSFKTIQDTYSQFKALMPSLLVNIDRTQAGLAKSLPQPASSILAAQVKQLQTELLNVRADAGLSGGEGRLAKVDVEKLRLELQASTEMRHKTERMLEVTQSELDAVKLSLKLHQQLVRAASPVQSSRARKEWQN